MSSSEARSGLIIDLAEEFLDRYRRGERPSLKEYINRHPELAVEIKEVFPAMALMENIAVDDSSPGGDAPKKAAQRAEAALKQLGDYRIIREIGHGGMGVVYEAEQVSLGRHVALKVLPSQSLSDGKHKRRFEREAKAAAKLHHTNIVPVFGVGEQDGLPYYVMQFIQGLGLDIVLDELINMQPDAAHTPTGLPTGGEIRISRRSGAAADVARSLLTGAFDPAVVSENQVEVPAKPTQAATEDQPAAGNPVPQSTSTASAHASGYSESFAVTSSSIILPGSSVTSGHKDGAKRQSYWHSVANIGRQVADALEYAHRQGVLHRDIKPSNLLLDLRGTVWVTDFGLAKVAGPGGDNLTHTGDILGTLRYMPPEAFDGKSDARSDVYSLGMTLYELLAMRPAFEEKDRHRLIKQVTTGEPPHLDKVRPEIPRDLVTIIQKSIAREPSGRYATAEELAADLQRFLDDEPIQARRQTQVERYVRWARHNPGIATLGGVLTAVLILATVASLLAAGYFNRLRLDAANAAQNERDARREAELSRQAEALQRKNAEIEKQRADDNAQNAEDKAQLAQQERQRADDNAKKADERAEAARKAEAEAKALLTRAEWLVYAGKLSLAQSDFETGNGGLALRFLDECQLDLRGWEHRHLLTRINAPQTLRGHTGSVVSVAFSPDGKRIVTASTDGATKVWDVATGQEVLLIRQDLPVRSMAFSPDGKRIVTGIWEVGRPSEVKVWDAETGRGLSALQGLKGRILCVAISHDGKRILTGSGEAYKPGEAQVWDSATGMEILNLQGHTREVKSVAFSPDDKRIVTGSVDGLAKIWDAATGMEVLTLKGHTGHLFSVAFSSDNKRIATGSDDRTAKVWDAATGRELFTLNGHAGWVWSVAFSPDNKHIVTGSVDTAVRIWNAATSQEVLALKGHEDTVSSVAFSADGKRIVSGSFDGTAKVWDAENGQKVLTWKGHMGAVRGLAFSTDGKRLVSGGSDGMAKVWDAATGKELVALKGHTIRVWGVAFSPDGKRVVSGAGSEYLGQPGKEAKVWDAATGRELFTLQAHTAAVVGVAYSPDGTRILTGTLGQSFGQAGVTSGEVTVWDAATGKELLGLDGPKTRIWSLAFSPNGKRIVTGDDRMAKVWDAETGKEVVTLEGAPTEVWSVAFSPDGQRVVTGGLDKAVRVWNALTGRIELTLRGHTAGVWGVAFSRDGKRIFSGSEDDSTRVWDARKGQELLALKGCGAVRVIAVSPDGKRLAAGNEDGNVKVWVAE